MSSVYDNWEKLVGAVVRREKDRQLAYCESFTTISSTGLSSRFSLDIPFAGDVHFRAETSTSSGQKFDLCSHNIFVFRNVMVIEYDGTRNPWLDMLLWKEESGRVHQGWIDEQFLTTTKRRSEIAAFVNNQEKHGLKDWLVQINYLGQVGRPNLVKLTGYRFHINTSFLKYEFLPKGSLDTYLISRWHQSPPWATRVKVGVGAARVLSLLHDMEIQTMQDGDLKAKLWDIGLAIKGPFDVIFQVGVTDGPYAAPEYIATGQLSAECDVYSFGFTLVELLSGRRALERRLSSGNYMINWAKSYLGDKERVWMIMDTRLNGEYHLQEAHEVGKIALQCVSSDPTSRPTMAEVVAALQRLL